MPKVKINDKITAAVESIDEKGRGTLTAGGKQALAYFVIPGERIKGTVTARTKGKLRIKVDKIIEPSPDRVVPCCPNAGRCGGCPWQHISYERQCDLKLGLVNQAFAEAELSESCKLTAENFVRAGEQYYHRNRMDYVFGRNGELGLKEPEHWDAVLDLKECFMLSPEAVEVMKVVRCLAKESNAPFWNNQYHTGFWRYLVIREGKNANERLVLITTSAELPDLPLREKFITALKPLATSLLWGVNSEITDLSIPKTIVPIFGESYLNETINGFSYRIPCASFFQTNSKMAAELQKTVVEFAAPAATDKIMDLYCGSGFLTLALARSSTKVIGVELDDDAIELARVNAELNSIKNIDFCSGATEKLLGAALGDMKPDTIVVDPPRVGLHPKALASLMEYGAKRLVYVSCNPVALARDLKTLLAKYSVEQMRCIDLFPHTPHIETVVSLKLKS